MICDPLDAQIISRNRKLLNITYDPHKLWVINTPEEWTSVMTITSEAISLIVFPISRVHFINDQVHHSIHSTQSLIQMISFISQVDRVIGHV